MNIIVRNLPRKTTEAELRALFTPFGLISSLNIVKDEKTNASKGFGFVEMPDLKEGKAAIQALNGKKIDGESIRVKSTRKK
ncbi:MAG: RNA-binding protein [Spirochaetales bacterium]|nr:RNA-binding protein [Spirochaetales bacterium]